MNPSPRIAVEIHPPLRPSQVATAVVRIRADVGTFVVNDVRILRNKQGVLWVSLPTFSVPAGGRSFEYRPSVELPPNLAQELNLEVLRAFSSQQDNETIGASSESSVPARR